MAIYYVRPEGVDTNNGTSWATALKTIAAAYNLMGGTDVCYVSKRTIEATTGASYLLAFDTGLSYVCLDDSQSPSLVAATGATFAGVAAVAVGGSSGYLEGFTFSPPADKLLTMGNNRCKYKGCTFNPSFTTIGGLTLSVPNGGAAEFTDCAFNFSQIVQCFTFSAGKYTFKGGSVSSVGTQNYLMVTSASGSPYFDILFDGVDFSGYDAASLLPPGLIGSGRITFRRCKFKSSFVGTIGASKVSHDALEVVMIECDVAGAGLTYRYEADYLNGEVKGRTSTYRTGGAQVSGFNISWDCNIRNGLFPLCFATPELIAYNENTTSAITVTIEFLAFKAGLTVGEVWMELSYLGDTTSMKGTVASSEPASYVNKTALVTTSAAAWVNAPAGYTAYKIALTVSPKLVGTLIAKLRANVVGNIIIDPYLTVS
jgi:hypothetical protein